MDLGEGKVDLVQPEGPSCPPWQDKGRRGSSHLAAETPPTLPTGGSMGVAVEPKPAGLGWGSVESADE